MAKIAQDLRSLWDRASATQRITLLGGLLASAAVVFVLFNWVSKPTMTLLYRQLAPEDAARIVEKIEEADIAYELKDNGTAIYVAKDHRNSLRLTMAAAGLPSPASRGFEIIEGMCLSALEHRRVDLPLSELPPEPILDCLKRELRGQIRMALR